MKKVLATLAAMVAAVILLGGCSSTPPQQPGASVEGRPGAGMGEGAATAGLAGRGGGAYTAADLNDPRSPLYQKVIYFDYDRSDIKPQFVDVLRAHASYLSSNPEARVRLEGHTDERGTREYNLALGEQRADTVRRFLIAEGVRDGQVDILSYGEERPADPGHNESAWALNRRVELVY